MNTALGMNDLHFVFDSAARKLVCWNSNHVCEFKCEARNKTTADGQYGHSGNCPPGEYRLGVPSARGSVPFGAYFVPILDYGDNDEMAKHHRSGIGIHGGGSGLAHPFAERQGWVLTHGCVRVQNADLYRIVALVNAAQQAGGLCYLTVSVGAPGAVQLADDWEAVAEWLLDPNE